MKARTTVVVERGGRLARLQCEPPLTVRQVRSDDPSTCALCLVGTAAGPLSGDEFSLHVRVCDEASATLQAAGANLAQGSGGARSMQTTVSLGRAARLIAAPGAVIVAQGCHVDVAVSIDLSSDAAVHWRETIVLGRTGESPGAATFRWDVTRTGRPVLRQFVDLADSVLAGWHGMTAGGRVLSSAFISDPALTARTIVASDKAVAAKLGEHTMLLTVLAADAAAATRTMDHLYAEAIRPSG